jgi:hypothetical protein
VAKNHLNAMLLLKPGAYMLWKKISLLLLFIMVLTSCTSGKPPETPDTLSSICQILRTRIAAYDSDGAQYLNTMKRKNPADQAELWREYYSYDCPVIVDFTPPP